MESSTADACVETSSSSNDLYMVVTCPKGLELLLADEIGQLGAKAVKTGVAHVECAADQMIAYKICMWSRLASRVLWPLTIVSGQSSNKMYEQLLGFSWLEHMSDRNTFRVTFSGMNDEIRNTHFGALKVKDAICDYFRSKTGRRPDVSANPDINFHAKLYRNELKLSLDLTGDALHKRGYRQSQGKAPLKENLAAAILLRANWHKLHQTDDANLIDPMCGSGTLLIEAALMAADIAPGLIRKHYGFERWKQHSSNIWNSVVSQARDRKLNAAQSDIELTLIGYDANSDVISKAKDNARRAGVEHFVHFKQQDLKDLSLPKGLAKEGTVITNPPYGERLSDEATIGALYESLGTKIKQHFPGWSLAVFTGNPEQSYQFRLRADKQYALYNGAIPCKLMLYKISESASSSHKQTQSPAIKLGNGAQMVCNRLLKNKRKLKTWLKKEKTDCFRLYDADMPEYAVAVDVYKDWVHVQEYTPPKSVDPEKAKTRLREVLDAIPAALGIDRNKIALKHRQVQKGKKQYERHDKQQQMMSVTEGNCQFYVNLTDYLDTGLFLDHRPIRTQIEQITNQKDFLNLFSYTCSASIHAAIGGARSTTSVDMSRTYLDWGRRNLALNGVTEKDHQFIQADCVKWLEEQQVGSKRYDVIFMDPPSFSNSKRMQNIFDVQRDHVQLIVLAIGLLRPNGHLIFSNNLRKFQMDYEALKMHHSDIEIVDITGQTIPQDFSRNPQIHSCFSIKR